MFFKTVDLRDELTNCFTQPVSHQHRLLAGTRAVARRFTLPVRMAEVVGISRPRPRPPTSGRLRPPISCFNWDTKFVIRTALAGDKCTVRASIPIIKDNSRSKKPNLFFSIGKHLPGGANRQQVQHSMLRTTLLPTVHGMVKARNILIKFSF